MDYFKTLTDKLTGKLGWFGYNYFKEKISDMLIYSASKYMKDRIKNVYIEKSDNIDNFLKEFKSINALRAYMVNLKQDYNVVTDIINPEIDEIFKEIDDKI